MRINIKIKASRRRPSLGVDEEGVRRRRHDRKRERADVRDSNEREPEHVPALGSGNIRSLRLSDFEV